MDKRFWILLALFTGLGMGCGEEAPPGGEGGLSPDVSVDEGLADGANPLDAAQGGTLGDGGVLDGTASDGAVSDGMADGAPLMDAGAMVPDLALPPLELRAPFEAPANPLEAGASCGVYQAVRCVDGVQQRCEIYDPATEAYVDEPDPLFRRVLLYDRWYDLYGSPDGQSAERVFADPVAGDVPESVWGAPERFSRYAGGGDSAIWTGVATTAATLRYLNTGTDADYARVEAGIRSVLSRFDVTGVPGYLARHHYLVLPEDGPNTDQHILHHGEVPSGPRDNPIEDPESIELPAAYLEGVVGPDGERVLGTPMWHGVPSIDQYTGPWVAFPLAYSLLRDDDLKARMVRHLTCYLNRLERLEVINVRANAEVADLLQQFFGSGALTLEEDDIDLASLDRLVAYYLPGFNEANAEVYDRSCPEALHLEPTLVIDASDPAWFVDFVTLAQRSQVPDENASPQQIDHIYAPSIRGGDASHLLHMAAVAYWLTGDEQYRRFFFNDLLDDIGADRVVQTMSAFRLPDFCLGFYGDHITYTTHWQFITMLPEGPFREQMERAMHEEFWSKAMADDRNAKFNLLYASVVGAPDAVAVPEAMAEIARFGGNGGTLDAPRRNYTRPRGELIDALPDDVMLRCPTEEERQICEMGISLLGFTFEGDDISGECTQRPGECVMADGECVDAIASPGLPVTLRQYADFMWQRDPFSIGESFGRPGQKQSPGTDLSEAFWLARTYGYGAHGAGQVLAWRDDGVCED